jgi:hypothetical protein
MKLRAPQSVLSSGVCLILCPLLVAQETAPIAPPQPLAKAASQGLPFQTPLYKPSPVATGPLPDKLMISHGRIVGLYTLDPISSATATVGSTIRLAAVQDLVLGGVTIVHKGTIVTGTITSVRRGVAGKTEARLEIRASNIPLGKALRLKLEDQPRKTHGEKAREARLWVLGAPIVVLASPLLIAMALEDRKPKPTGEDIVYEACTFRPFYVASDMIVPISALDPVVAGVAAPL